MNILRSFGRVVKYGVIACTVTGSVVVLQSNDWKILSTGVVRFGRAAVAVSIVAADYKYSMRGLDESSAQYQVLRSQIHTRNALRLRKMCETNGGCFIKVGQHIGVLEYLVPYEYVKVMRVLHTDAPQTPLRDLYSVVEQDLGKPVSELFSRFEEKPLAAASVAQVHKAVLKDGTPVVVKIQHPTVRPHSFVDMATMEFLVRVVIFMFPGFKFGWVAEETRRNLPMELNFISEATHCETVAKRFSHLKFFRVPQIHWNLTTERVLTMEFCEGGHINDKQYILDNGLYVKDVLQKLGRLYSEMIFVQGYIHCDPHPGNVLVHKNKSGSADIILLDHGLYKTLSDDVRINYCGLWQSVLTANIDGIRNYSQLLGVGKMYPLFACMLTARSWSSVSQGIDRSTYSSQEESMIRASASTYFNQISDILNQVPRQLLLVFKTNDLIRGIEAALDSRADASSFLIMSRCCVQALSDHQYRSCRKLSCRIVVTLHRYWLLTKLSIYERCLWFTSTSVCRYIAAIFHSSPALVPQVTMLDAVQSTA